MSSAEESFEPNGGKDDCLAFLVSTRTIHSEMVRHIRQLSAQSGWSPVTMAIRLGLAGFHETESATELHSLVVQSELTSDMAILAYVICSKERCSVEAAIQKARLNSAIGNSGHVV